jgi:hypothetical protein
MLGLYGNPTHQHDSNFPIHEGFGDFYVNLGDSRALYKEIQPLKPKDASIDLKAEKQEKEFDDYQKAMEEYATVKQQLCPCFIYI